jgi:hypothetical protein
MESMRNCWTVVALFGCYSPNATVGLPCSSSGTCPDDQTCDHGQQPPVCVASIHDARPVDTSVSDSGSDAGVDAPAITFVQVASTKPAAAVTTLAFNGAVIAKDAIVVCLKYPSSSGATLLSISDTSANTYNTLVGPITSGTDTHYLAAAFDAKAGATTLTVTLSATVPMVGSDLFVLDYSGIVASNAFDASSSQSGSTAAMTSGSATTSTPHELIVGFAAASNATSGAGFTSRVSLNGNLAEDRVVMATGSYAATANTGGNGAWTMIMATFKGQ